MRKTICRIVVAAMTATTLACNGGADRAPLVGKWQLVMPAGCDYGLVKSDHLVLRADGSMEQNVEFEGGENYFSKVERWDQLDRRSISLNRRLNVPKDAPREKRREVLVVEGTNPPIILLDPDKNCFYEKIK